MSERRRQSAADTPRGSGQSEGGRLDYYQSHLVIDKDHLDDAVMNQPELFYHVSEQLSLATARRDRLKYDIEIAEAEEAAKIRDDAKNSEAKITEKSIADQLVLTPRLQKLREARLVAEAEMGAWSTLQSAYQQRSYMLRELVPMFLARLNPGSIRGDARGQLADGVGERAGAEREERGYRRGDRQRN